MFFYELKFVIDLLKKWLAEKLFNRYKKLAMFKKQRFKMKNPINKQTVAFVIFPFPPLPLIFTVKK